MPWYRMQARYGPGHQSGGNPIYFWAGHRLNRDEKQMYFDDTYQEHDWPIGGIRLVRKLPKRVIEQKIQDCHDAIRYRRRMLNILARTPVRRTPDPAEVAEHRSRVMLGKLRREAEQKGGKP